MATTTTFSFLLRLLLFLFAVSAVGLVSFVCVQLHDSFVKYTMVSSSICLALELQTVPLLLEAIESPGLRRVIALDDLLVFALSLAAAIVMSREIRVARVAREISALSAGRERAVYASVAFLWTVFAVSAVVMLANLREIGRDVDQFDCGEDAISGGYSQEKEVQPLDEMPVRESEKAITYAEMRRDPGFLAHAVVIPYV